MFPTSDLCTWCCTSPSRVRSEIVYRGKLKLDPYCIEYCSTNYHLHQNLCVCECVVIPFMLDVMFVDVPAGFTHRRKVTQKKAHTGFLNLPSAVLALVFLVRRIQPFLSLVDRQVEFCVLTNGRA